MIGSVSCPQRRRVNNRRTEQQKWRTSPEWKEFVRVHTEGRECVHCKGKTGEIRGKRKPIKLTVNHISRRKYISKEEYLTWDDDCEVCCTTCNWMFEKAKRPCPKCLIRYIPWYEQECDTCYYKDHPEQLRKKEEAKRLFKQKQKESKAESAKKRKAALNKHPCAEHGTERRCKVNRPFLCQHSAKWAKQNCEKFREREKV